MNHNIERKKDDRLIWIDALRSMAMIFVIYGHQVPEWKEYFVFTSPIKICLFFAISGYVFKEQVNEKSFYNNIFRKLFIPWLVFAIVPYALSVPFKGSSIFITRVTDIIHGMAAWYIPCCIVAEIVWHYVLKYCSTWWQIIVTSIVLSIIGIYFGNKNILNIWMINRALVAQMFLLIGWLIKKDYNSILKKNKVPITVSFAIIYIALGIVSMNLFPGKNLDVHTNEYYSYFICFTMIWTGNIIAFIIFESFSRIPKFFIMIGANTLFIYLSHDYVIYVFKYLVGRFSISTIVDYRFTAVIISIITCFVCTFISIKLKKYMPWLFGLKKDK